MSVEEIKHSITTLSPTEQSEVSAFLFHLRRAADADYQERTHSKPSDRGLGAASGLEARAPIA